MRGVSAAFAHSWFTPQARKTEKAAVMMMILLRIFMPLILRSIFNLDAD
jgi:hypothetical protein